MPTNYINQYRKQIGTYNVKHHKPTDKSLRKAIRKARNAEESICTHRNNNSSGVGSLATVFKAALVVGVVCTAIAPAGAMLHGQKSTNAKTRSTVPLMGQALRSGERKSVCTAWKVSKNELVTAKHCVDSYDPWGYIAGTKLQRAFATKKIDHPDKNVDLCILRFENYDLAGSTHCIPKMSQETFKILMESPPNICGDEGRLIVAGRGVSEETGQLYTNKFDFYDGHYRKNKLTGMQGVLNKGERALVQSGDSGGAVFGCNPFTGQYEYVGAVSAGSQKSDSAVFVNVAFFSEVGDWITQNTSPCVNEEDGLAPNDLYRGNHALNRCKLPTKYYEKAGMNNTEICECYDKIAAHPPLKYGCETASLEAQVSYQAPNYQAPSIEKNRVTETTQMPTHEV